MQFRRAPPANWERDQGFTVFQNMLGLDDAAIAIFNASTPDGKELFYVAANQKLSAVAVDLTTQFVQRRGRFLSVPRRRRRHTPNRGMLQQRRGASHPRIWRRRFTSCSGTPLDRTGGLRGRSFQVHAPVLRVERDDEAAQHFRTDVADPGSRSGPEITELHLSELQRIGADRDLTV